MSYPRILSIEVAKKLVESDSTLFMDYIEDVTDESLVCEESGETAIEKLCAVYKEA